MKKQLHSRSGVSVAEVVIALAIIAIISAFTLSLIVMSISVESKSVAAIEVKNAAENAIECFRFARDNQGKEFLNPVLEEMREHSLSELFFLCLKKSDGNYVSPDEVEGDFLSAPLPITAESKFVLETDNCTITIEQIKDDDSNVIGFSFVAMRGEEELENFTFPKGVE